jgi:hypothetical protein
MYGRARFHASGITAPRVGLTSAVHLQNAASLPYGLLKRCPAFWQVQPLVSRQQPVNGLEPHRAMMEKPSPPIPRAPSVGFQRKAERPAPGEETTSISVRDQRRPGNRSAVKNGKENAANQPGCIGVFHHHCRPRTDARGSITVPSPSAPNSRHHTVLSRIPVLSPDGSNRSRREALERVDDFIRRDENHSWPKLHEPGHETRVNQPLLRNRPLVHRCTANVRCSPAKRRQSTARSPATEVAVLAGATAC